MKVILVIFLTVLFSINLYSQTIVQMEKLNGVYVMPCLVNGLALKFIVDTGASDVSISLVEALFMLKNGYLAEEDLIGTEYYRIANGEIEEGTSITLKSIEIGNLKLDNVKASIVHSLSAPLLLGQTALTKLGTIEFDYAQSTLTIKGGSPNGTNWQNSNSINDGVYTGSYKFTSTLDNPSFDLPLRSQPSVSALEIYKCPKNATIYVIDNSGDLYFKVYVNGYTGYISKQWLTRQR